MTKLVPAACVAVSILAAPRAIPQEQDHRHDGGALGELLLDLKRPIAALAAFEESQRGDPRRFRNVYGAGRAAELAGKRDKARTNYSELLRQVGTNATGRPEIEHAKAYVAKL